MKKLLLLVGAITATTFVMGPGVSLQAETPRPEASENAKPDADKKKHMRMSVEERVVKMSEELNLDDAQKEKVTEILKAEEAAHKELRDDKDMDKDARREKMKEIRENTKTAMDEVLTPEQLEILKESKPKREPKPKTESAE